MAERIKGERVERWRTAVKRFIDERREIAKWSTRQVESSVRTGKPVILEFEIPPSLSAEFEEERRRRIRDARYKLLKTFEPFRRFTEKRIVE